jgi:hypothetical protein
LVVPAQDRDAGAASERKRYRRWVTGLAGNGEALEVVGLSLVGVALELEGVAEPGRSQRDAGLPTPPPVDSQRLLRLRARARR